MCPAQRDQQREEGHEQAERRDRDDPEAGNREQHAAQRVQALAADVQVGDELVWLSPSRRPAIPRVE